jgi:hypothetical protein
MHTGFIRAGLDAIVAARMDRESLDEAEVYAADDIQLVGAAPGFPATKGTTGSRATACPTVGPIFMGGLPRRPEFMPASRVAPGPEARRERY